MIDNKAESEFENRCKMSVAINQSIVNGILQGYKNYIEERKVKKEEIIISTAYAWVRGNHIDDQTAVECDDLEISFTKAKAGYTWGYLQFNIEKEKRMFIIKNAKYFDENDFPRAKGIRKQEQGTDNETYLKKLSRINSQVDFPEEQSLFSKDELEMVSIFDEATRKQLDESDARMLEEAFDLFYIITYEIDESHALSKIKVLMPNPHNDQAYVVDDLSELIGKSPVSFETDDYEVLVDDGFDAPDVPAATDYGIVAPGEIKEGEGK